MHELKRVTFDVAVVDVVVLAIVAISYSFKNH